MTTKHWTNLTYNWYYFPGFGQFTQFQSAYWIEKALSVDNLFVFILVFGFFNVPKRLHHRVLFWGIIGALLFRALFIFTGVGLINHTYLPEMRIFGDNVKINVVLSVFGFFQFWAYSRVFDTLSCSSSILIKPFFL
jgi:tellurite resistance protein TerC